MALSMGGKAYGGADGGWGDGGKAYGGDAGNGGYAEASGGHSGHAGATNLVDGSGTGIATSGAGAGAIADRRNPAPVYSSRNSDMMSGSKAG